MGQFRWLSSGEIPEELDLRRRGWDLAASDRTGSGCVTLVHAAGLDHDTWAELMALTRHEDRRMMLVGSANSPEGRANLLAEGFGDAVGDDTPLGELEARARRLAEQVDWLPRRRVMAMLELDVLAREATYMGRSLSLHPREFALLWRLSDTPDQAVSRDALVQDIWRLDFAPESNSISVHMSRLRQKLKAAGLSQLVETVSGGYRLRCATLDPVAPSPWLHDRIVPKALLARPGRLQ